VPTAAQLRHAIARAILNYLGGGLNGGPYRLDGYGVAV